MRYDDKLGILFICPTGTWRINYHAHVESQELIHLFREHRSSSLLAQNIVLKVYSLLIHK